MHLRGLLGSRNSVCGGQRGLSTEVVMEIVWIEKLAIQELCSRYCQTIDAQDSDGWARCFLPEGAFEFDGHVVRGYAALCEYAEAHTRVVRGRHITFNHLCKMRSIATGRRARDHGCLDSYAYGLQDHGPRRLL